ncbi:MAG: immunity protein 32 [Verrucomicrobia bacterium]|nr:immunity protein 32 [Verrucomicrobiota bacterium]
MNSNKPYCLLTFEWDPKNEILEIHSNQNGLKKLKNTIDLLLTKSENDHIHLMTKEWGGDELSDEKQCSENETINHVKIFKWIDIDHFH